MKTFSHLERLEQGVAHARGIAKTFAASLRDHFGSRLKQARLFGSAARGHWSMESDIDVLVLLDRVTTQDVEWTVRLAFSLGVMRHEIVLQPTLMTEEEFLALKEKERRFALEIDRYGMEL